MNRIKSIPLFLFISVFLTACSSSHSLDIRVTEDNYKSVSLSQGPEKITEEPYRVWANDHKQFLFDPNTDDTPIRVTGDRLNILALSGGGANGAFGAGVINGLYDSNQLEEYSVVTGISAGSLIAPFVFVGGDEVHRLKSVMLGINDDMVLGDQNFLNALIKDAFTNGQNLFEFIEEVYTPEMIKKIALQHKTGRRLLIGTTHFDSDQLVIWNVGQIAQSDMPNKVRLIHQILAASSSIPGVFPPQFIEVNTEGQILEELHVDGGLATQVFFAADIIDYKKISQDLGLDKAPQVNVIRNGMFKMPYQPVEDKGVDLISKSIQSMTLRQSRGDLYRMMYFCEINGLDLNFTYIEDQFDAPKKTQDMFDLEYMKALYQYGYDKFKSEQPWAKELP